MDAHTFQTIEKSNMYVNEKIEIYKNVHKELLT